MDPDYLPFHPNPSKPRFQVPAGAVDAHCHVFGPGDVFPYAPERKYTPCDAPKEKLFALRDYLGFARNVIVQATCHGNDNRALVDALQASKGMARGVACGGARHFRCRAAGLACGRCGAVRASTSSSGLVDFTPREVLAEIAARIAPLGWHVVIYFEAQDLPELWDFFTSLPTTVVVDHMGRPDVSKPVDGPEFELFMKLMREHPNIWSKVSCPERLSKSGAAWPMTTSCRLRVRLVETFPDRSALGHRLAASQHEIAHARRRSAGGLPAAHRAVARAATGFARR